MSDVDQFATYFFQGLKVTVCIPMDNNEMFRDWAIVDALEKDMITLQLSRDELPVSVRLVAGLMLDLHVGTEESGYRCGGLFIKGGDFGKIRVLLTGDISAIEPREFYRIDVFIPYRYQFSEEQNMEVLIGKWRKRRRTMLVREAERREAFIERHRERLLRAVIEESEAEGQEQLISKPQNVEVYSDVDETWDDVNAYLINLSAGGLKFVTTDDFDMDELVFFEMLIPVSPPRIIDTVALVVSKNNNYSFKDGKEHFNVAVHFVLIDDRDRDAIVSYITQMEAQRIRLKGQLPYYYSQSENKFISPLKISVSVLLLVVLIAAFSFYYYEYSLRDIHNEIQETFGKAVKQYREKTGTQNLWK